MGGLRPLAYLVLLLAVIACTPADQARHDREGDPEPSRPTDIGPFVDPAGWPSTYDGPRDGPYFVDGPEHVRFLAACLIDAGYSVRLRDDLRGYSVGEGRPGAQLQRAQGDCNDLAHDLGLVATPARDDRFLKLQYEAFMWTHNCLVGIGAPTTPPPSLEAFLDDLGAGWTPYDGLPSGGEVALAEEGMAPPSGDVALQLEQQVECPMHLPTVFNRMGVTAADLIDD